MKEGSVWHYTYAAKKKTNFAKNVLRDLPGFQDFSGRDLTSAFLGILKRKWLNIAKSNKEYYKAQDLPEESLQIDDHLFDMTENMLCLVYGFLKNLMPMTFHMKSAAARNLLKLLTNSTNRRRIITTCYYDNNE